MAIHYSKTASNTLKILGITSMVVDHIGFAFFPQAIFFRIIGRLAFPIFAAGIANGYKHTSDLKKYATRLFVFGLVSQLPFMLFFGGSQLNIIFTLLAGLVLIYLLDRKKYLPAVVATVLLWFVPLEYGMFGVATVLLFFFLDSKAGILAANFFLVSAYVLLKGQQVYLIYYFSLFGVAVVLYSTFLEKVKIPKLPKYFFYFFYPSHLALLALVRYLIN